MLLQRNLLETVTLISCSGSFICILLNYVTNISPITGVWFHLYIFVLFIVSVTCSFKLIQWLLHLNKPLKYDADTLLTKYPYLGFLFNVLPRPPKKVVRECKEYDTNELSVISTVLERRLVSSWYTHYVSQDIGFPFACKQMLDQMIGKTFQICNKIETKDVYVDICSVFIHHLKEYKKAVKRHEKSPDCSIASLYKTSHQIFTIDKNIQSAEHCTNLLRVILKELVPWELWDTPHSELLVRILSKRLNKFVDSTLADPVWLNDKLMTLLKGKKSASKETETTGVGLEKEVVFEEKKDIVQDINITEPEKENISLPTEELQLEGPTIESALSTIVAQTTAPILQNAVDEFEPPILEENIIESSCEEVTTGTAAVDIVASPVMRQRRGRQGRNEVKIYDRIIEGSVKTWETDTDLQCISLGQDLLASLNGELSLSRLWGQDPGGEGREGRLWFGEEETLDIEIDTSPSKEPSPVKKEHSPKPTEVLLKDLQTTVHQAKTKIGDLQVPKSVLDVPDNDEAAGMMEGLLDFGISNLKKGLRFTGLSDDSQDKSPSYREEKRPAEKSPPPDSKHKPSEAHKLPEVHALGDVPKLAEIPKYPDPKETGNTSLLQKEENGNPTVPLLVKQHRVSSQDSLPAPTSTPRPTPAPLGPLCDSPEPEYEETEDLSTSIAKLRCLLQQRAEAQQRCLLQQRAEAQQSKGEEVWWEGAEETRGRTQQHPSSRNVDSATLADEYDMTAERNSSPNQASNNMQRLDKLFQRTVTGVFNSIKTAVGAEGEGPGGAEARGDWAYVCTSVELSVGGAVARLVGSRRAYSHVETALDSLDQLATVTPAQDVTPEDFEEWLVVAGSGWCACAELLSAAGLIHSHVALRLAACIAADLAESFINAYVEEVSSWLRAEIFAAFERLQAEQDGEEEKAPLREFDLDETCQAVVDAVPGVQVFGADTVHEAARLTVSSFSHKQLNTDVLFRVLDVFAAHFKRAAALKNPSFDNN